MIQSKDFSVIVPVFNSSHTIAQLCKRLVDVFVQLDRNFEIILVDDSSNDNSWQVIKELASTNSNIHGYRLMRNFGQPRATMAGLQAATGKFMITIDDDLQNPPEEILKMVNIIEKDPNIDVVIGVPIKKAHAMWRNWSSNVINYLSNKMFSKTKSFKLTSFRLMKREVVVPLLELNISTPAPGALLNTITPRMVNIGVEHVHRKRGKSGYTFTKLLNLMIDKFLGFSTFPLRLLAVTGLLGVFFSIALGTFFLIRYIYGDIKVPGWTSLIIVLIASSGFNFLALGIIGEYLQQILLSVRNTQTFIIREKT